MILHGNTRGGAKNLADHLMSPENEFVTLHSIEGFACDDLHGALKEAYGVSKGTRCRKFLYSLSLNGPPDQEISTDTYIDAAQRVEKELGLTGQPRAFLFHEKESADGKSRRHMHAVWARIDPQSMKAVQISWDRKKLQSLSRDLFIEHGWSLPRGFINPEQKSMKNFTHDQWQQAKRTGKDPRAIKEAFQDAWAVSDSKAAFTEALRERGYHLARGDRRGYVGVDERGEVYSAARMIGIKTKEVRERLGDENVLPSVEEAKDRVANEMLPTLGKFQNELEAKKQKHIAEIKERKATLVEQQKTQRNALTQKHEARKVQEALARQARYRGGVKGIWDRLSGTHKKISVDNAKLAELGQRRDRAEQDALVFKQMTQRKVFSTQVHEQKQDYLLRRQSLKQDVKTYTQMKAPPNPTRDAKQAFMDKRRAQVQSPPRRTRRPKPR